jgi:hypothetical protein
MRREKTKKIAVMSTITLLALILIGTSLISSVHALTFPKSSKIAMVPSSFSSQGGSLYTGATWPNSDSFTFVNVAVADISNGGIPDPIVAGGYDTVVIMAAGFNFATAWSDPDFNSRITSFVNSGGKLIIYTSETPYANAFANFIYPFTVDTPGQTGSFGGTLTNPVDDTLTSSNPADASYINLGLITSQTDAVGDLTVMTSYDSNWYIDLFGINVYQVGGPGHTYAFYGSGLIIFNGLDVDYAGTAPTSSTGAGNIGMIWWRELCGQTLGPSINVNGLTLDPEEATNAIGTTHTVTATVRNTETFNPIPNIQVTFEITSGPNTGVTGTGTTDSAGQTTFSWSSSTVGTDTLTASIPNSNVGAAPIETTATKDWIPGNVIPEGPFGTIALSAAMLVGIGLFFGRNKILKAIKP